MPKLPSFALGRGMMSGNRIITSVSTVIAVLRVLQKISGTGPKTIYKGKLQPGQTIVISDRESPK